MTDLVTAWSYSRLELYERCPFAFHQKHIAKLPDPGGPAMQRGNIIHKLAEEHALGRLTHPPEELKHFAKEFKEKFNIDVNENPKARLRVATACEKLVEAAAIQFSFRAPCRFGGFAII